MNASRRQSSSHTSSKSSGSRPAADPATWAWNESPCIAAAWYYFGAFLLIGGSMIWVVLMVYNMAAWKHENPGQPVPLARRDRPRRRYPAGPFPPD
jgi:hypothetical protein